MTGTMLVTGGTGTLGRLVVARLRAAGRDVRVLSRTGGDVTGDLATGEGIGAAVAGAGVIVHLAGSARGDDEKARRLVQAAAAQGRPHVVFVSIVGAGRIPVRSAADRAMFGLFAAKAQAERLIADSGLPWTTLRATQFHDLVLATVRGMARMPVVPVPSGFRLQPVDAAEVADRLAELAQGEPAGLVADLGGPRSYELRELLRGYLRARGAHRLLVGVRLPGGAARAYRAGANLTPERAVGRRTWEAFLDEHLRATSNAAPGREALV